MKEINVIGNPKMLSKEIKAVASYGLVDKHLKNFVFTYLKVNNITLEQLKQNIHNKTSDLTKSQREFVLNNL